MDEPKRTVYTGTTVYGVPAQLDPVALVADVAEAALAARTRLALARRVAEALARHVPLVGLELGWCPPGAGGAGVDRADLAVARPTRRGLAVADGSRRLAATLAGEALDRGQAAVRDLARGGARLPPDARQAARAGAAWLAVLPLEPAAAAPGALAPRGRAGGEEPPGARGARDRAAGYAALAVGAVPAAWLESGLLGALARVLRGAHEGLGVLARVAAASRRAYVENAALRRRLASDRAPRLVARSAAMRDLLERLDLVAVHDTTVLLRGESGTGKELLARRLHERSPRRGGPFVAVNCGALPDALVESELFGHERGAFTGAARRHVGRFERARRGTLFLDEVADLPLPAQVKLLRALQDGEVEPVGAEAPRPVDVRVVAATNRPLEAMVREGRLREDLYFRLDVFPLHVPPLRERVEDLPELVAELLADVSARLGRPAPGVGAATLARLGRHPWPGNVRELRNVLERAAILSRGEQLELPPWPPARTTTPAPRPLEPGGGRAPETLEAAARRCVVAALEASRGRIYGRGGAAELLGVPPSTLQTRLARLGLRRVDFVAR